IERQKIRPSHMMAKGRGQIYVNLIRDGSCSRHWGMSYKLGRNNFDTYTIKDRCDRGVNIE
ncbi:hypothetical protein OCE55_20345, partial [Bacillus paranthracis]|uniref:hypothetical protein n=1 Tax=Bacillus paranthracis TaxID=2026186 RepID=UPI0021D30B29